MLETQDNTVFSLQLHFSKNQLTQFRSGDLVYNSVKNLTLLNCILKNGYFYGICFLQLKNKNQPKTSIFIQCYLYSTET